MGVLVGTLAACGANPSPGKTGGGSSGSQLTFQQSCQNRQGIYLPAAGALPELCKFRINLTASWFNYNYNFISRWNSPRLNPGDYSTATPTYPMVELHAGDRVTFSGTGQWDKSDGFQCQNWRNLDGVMSGSTQYNPAQPNPLAQPQGLLALDGNEIVFMGSNSTWTSHNGGVLYIGLNMVGNNSSQYCWSVYPTVFYVTHCEDSATTTHACP